MKGVIFKHFESFVTDTFGADVYEDLLDRTELTGDGAFVGPETYPDADLFALVGTAISSLQIPLADALYAFGKYLFAKLAGQVPMFVDYDKGLKSFLLTIHSVIHVEVKKLFPGAETPHFAYEDPGDGHLVIEYTSARKLCPLFRGLIDGAAEAFGETISFEESQCMHDGAASCRFEIAFAVPLEKAG